jgi:hypothetical protein
MLLAAKHDLASDLCRCSFVLCYVISVLDYTIHILLLDLYAFTRRNSLKSSASDPSFCLRTNHCKKITPRNKFILD